MLYTALYMASVRTQVYLTVEQRRRIWELMAREGISLAALIRAAVDAYLDGAAPDVKQSLAATFGVSPDFVVPSRDEWDRG